ncbi:RHS repeat domain-containing protein [Bdellovibrio bacteriovorus]
MQSIGVFLLSLWFGVPALAEFADVTIVPYEKSGDPSYFGCYQSGTTCTSISYPTPSGNAATCVIGKGSAFQLTSQGLPGAYVYIYEYTNQCGSNVNLKASGPYGGTGTESISNGARVYLIVSTETAGERVTKIEFNTSGNSSPQPPPPTIPTPQQPDPKKPYPVSSYYPGQCRPGVLGNTIAGFSVIDLSTRSFTEEIPIPGAPFSLVYNSSYYVVGGRNFPKDHDIGGWVSSIDSFYDRKKNIVFHGDGTVQVLSIVPEVDSRGQFIIFDPSGLSYSGYDPYEGKFYFKNEELTHTQLLNTSSYEGNIFAGFVDSSGDSYFFTQDRRFIAAAYPATEILATLSYLPNGKLETVTLPNGAKYVMTYNAEGRLSSFRRPLGKLSYFEYDSEGNLLKDSSSSGRSISIQTKYDQTKGRLDVVSTTGNGIKNTALTYGSKGTTTRYRYSDYGGQSYSTSVFNSNTHEVYDLYGGHTKLQLKDSAKWGAHTQYSAFDTFTAGPLLIKKQEVQELRGAVILTSVFLQGDSKRKYEFMTLDKPGQFGKLVKSPMGREYAQVINDNGQPTMQMIGRDNKVSWAHGFSYDSAGKLTEYKNGDSRVVATFNYTSSRLLEKITDGLGNVTEFSYDTMKRLSKIRYATGSVTEFSYDLEGNLTGIKPPGRPFHDFLYNMGELVGAYNPPVLAGQHTDLEYKYDDDDRISEILVGGNLVSSYKYGPNESRLIENKNSHTSVEINYAQNQNKLPTDLISSLKTSDGVVTNYSYLWKLPLTTDTKTSSFSSSVRYKYNTDATLSAIEVAGSDGKYSSNSFSYDLDGFVTKSGNSSFGLDIVGRIQNSTHGLVKGQILYNPNGSVSSETYSVNGKTINNVVYSRDVLERILSVTSKVPSQTISYSYDKVGRLVSVQNGNIRREYIYDENGNRIEFKSGNISIKGKYDDQDRLISYGANQYEYSNFGSLTKRVELRPLTQNPLITEYNYDSIGNLRSVKLPDGRLIEYIIDGQNRRIGKKINGKVVQAFIFQSKYQIAAELDGAGKIIRRFIYGAKINIPDYVIVGGREYRIISDIVGTPKLIVEASTGKIVETLNYDEFGVSVDGKHSSYLPFGFAGGVNDRDTGLVRFGARDYSPEAGRWTGKDPIIFNGGDLNLFGYVANDPINWIDFTGEARSLPDYLMPDGASPDEVQTPPSLIEEIRKKIKGRYKSRDKFLLPPKFQPSGVRGCLEIDKSKQVL